MSDQLIPSVRRAAALAQALDVPLDWLAGLPKRNPKELEPDEEEALGVFRSLPYETARREALKVLRALQDSLGKGAEIMAFIQQDRRPFTKAGIDPLLPNWQGVYGLFRGQECIYVGGGNIRAELSRYLAGENPCITRNKPTEFVFEVRTAWEARERELILELNPPCNRRQP